MTENRQPYALVFGVSVFDICGFTDRNYRCNDSNPGKVKTSFGGVCRNIAECMARVGVNTKFISILGDDETGNRMIEHSKIMNYDMSESLIVKGGYTPTYMAILDEQGEMVSAVVDMKIIDMFTTDFIDSKSEIIKNAEYMILDSDRPDIVEYLIKTFSENTKFILDPVSAAKAKNIKHLIKYFHTIKPNRYEAEKGAETLGKLIDTDEGSHYLGEVALVPFKSPISDTNIVFFNTLFDENASCHFAIGSAYKTCIKNGDDIKDEELDKYGVNNSLTHVDFMIGSNDMNIVGITHQGEEVQVFKDGNWAF